MKYVVCEEAVYLHRLYGPYWTLRGAKKQANELANKDVDAHHDWVVRTLDPVNGLCEEDVYATRKPNCVFCDADPVGALWPFEHARPCPCESDS